MKVQNIDIDKIKPYDKNPRNNDEAVEYVANSLKEFGWQQPIVVDKDMIIVVGHTRYKAAQKLGYEKVPVVVADKLTPEQIKAYRLADNKTAEKAEWDVDLLDVELNDIDITSDLDMTDFGFDLNDLEEEQQLDPQISEDQFEADENEIETDIQKGQVFKLGRHRLMCGDSTSKDDVNKLIGKKIVDLVFTDPPYGMKKENDGVANDNLNFDKLLKFNQKWIPLTLDVLKRNGSWYCWGIDEPLMDIYSSIIKPKIKDHELTFRNLITWDKGSGQGQNSEQRLSYATADEKCLFVMKGNIEVVKNSDEFPQPYSPVQEYLESEAKSVGLTSKKYKELFNSHMFNHYFTKSQFTLIKKSVYEKLHQIYPKNFKKPYQEIKNQFVEARELVKKDRPYFNNTFDNMNNVWHFSRTSVEERELTGGHATPKPIALCARAIQASSRENENVLDVFGGSGSTLVACEQLGRNALLMELDPKWCQVIINRWETLTGKKAERIV